MRLAQVEIERQRTLVERQTVAQQRQDQVEAQYAMKAKRSCV
jgi:hypothetical protein